MADQRYVTIEKDEFERFLQDTGYKWEEVTDEINEDRHRFKKTKEYVYQTTVKNDEDGREYLIRLWSSIDVRSDETRDKGKDSIKLVVLDKENEVPVFKEKRTYRVEGWRSNLEPKIENLSGQLWKVPKCPDCGGAMTVRENSETGEAFYGCLRYPDCRGTKPYKGLDLP